MEVGGFLYYVFQFLFYAHQVFDFMSRKVFPVVRPLFDTHSHTYVRGIMCMTVLCLEGDVVVPSPGFVSRHLYIFTLCLPGCILSDEVQGTCKKKDELTGFLK